MSLYKKTIASPEVERTYNEFMLVFEVKALRITCVFGMIHVFLFMVLDYWRVEHYSYVLIYRSASMLVILAVLLFTYDKHVTVTHYNFLCLLLCTAFPICFYLLDQTAGMPDFFLPNSSLLFFYVFNACLGHSFKAKTIHTGILAAFFIFYSYSLSPHRATHISQMWNILLNASISLLIGFLVVWFKRLSFIQQEQLVESNTKLDLALRSVEMGVWSWDIKTNKRVFDRQTCQLLGIDYETFDGSPEAFFKAIHPQDLNEVKILIKDAFDNRRAVISPEYRVVWADGSIHHVKGRAKIFYDEEGNPARLNGIGWDVTEQKKIEQEFREQQDALNESESKFRQISETINDVFYLYNIVERRYEFISKNCEQVLGAAPDFFYRGEKYTATYVLEDDRQKMHEANLLVNSGTPYEVEFRILHHGEIKWIREKSFPIKDENGKVIKNSGICTDITHLKSQEIQLMAQKRHLETLNNTKDKFFSIVAHDLKSPLNSLKAFTSLLIDRTEYFSKEEIIQTSKQAQQSVDNTIKMADNLIAWARLQMNDYENKPEQIHFREIVSTLLPVYKRIAEKKGIGLSWSYTDELTVYGDKNQIEFIVRNLLNNAVKFTHKEGAIQLHAFSLDNGHTRISVTDNGIGISDDGKQKLFSVGKNQSSKGTSGEKGTGLGLMLCYEFTKLNGGTIAVDSEEGKGATFNVTLRSRE